MAFDPTTATLADAPPATSFDPSSAQLADATPPAAAPETVGRIAGLGARALGSGAADLAALPSSPLINPANALINPARQYLEEKLGVGKPAAADGSYEPQLADFIHPDKWRDAVNFLADKAGLAKPETAGERVASKAVEAIPSAALSPEAPIAGALSAAAGSGTSQYVQEQGGSPLQQTLASLAVGSVPALASAGAQGVRSLVRNQADTAGRLADAKVNGTPLSAGQVTDSRLLQSIESASTKGWGGGPIKALAEDQTEHLGSSVDTIVNNLAPGAEVSPTAAGAAINAGAATTKQNMRAAEKAAYDKVDQLVPPQSPVDVSGTLSKLNELATPTPGAEATTNALISPKIKAMRDNLQADVAKNGGTAVPYSAATDLRTQLGNSIDWGFAPADPVANGALKLVHGALKGDIDAGASAISPEAKQAVSDARTLYTQNENRRNFLNGIIDKAGGPEAVYAAATNGTKQGATKISGVMDALDPGQQNLVRATVIDRLGKAIPSQQNATGDAFNASTFLTNWAKLHGDAKDALFGSSGALRSGLDSLANTMSTVRNSKIFPNPSGTSEAMGHGMGLFALLEGGGAALMGHPGHLAAVGGAIAANNLLARALTNKRTVTWLASTAKLPTSGIPNAVNQLAKINDPDARELAAYLQAQQGNAQ